MATTDQRQLARGNLPEGRVPSLTFEIPPQILPNLPPSPSPPPPSSTWLAGNNGHAVSRPVAQYVSDNLSTLWEGQGEDTSLGIWIDESPLKARMKWVKSGRFSGSLMWFEGKCEEADKFSIGHNISPETMRKCYEMMDENEGAEEKLRAIEG